MKYKNKLKRLALRQQDFENLDPSKKRSMKKPGSPKKLR